jgi:hypothetical protein
MGVRSAGWHDDGLCWRTSAGRDHANYGPEHGFGHGFASGPDRWVYSSPVGWFPPNALGLYDMSGNVLQWVQDCFAPSYADATTNGTAYEAERELKLTGDLAEFSGKSCWYHTLRGGDWAILPNKSVRRSAILVQPIRHQRDMEAIRVFAQCRNRFSDGDGTALIVDDKSPYHSLTGLGYRLAPPSLEPQTTLENPITFRPCTSVACDLVRQKLISTQRQVKRLGPKCLSEPCNQDPRDTVVTGTETTKGANTVEIFWLPKYFTRLPGAKVVHVLP